MAGFGLIRLAVALYGAIATQQWPQTKAEATNFKQTSSYADVISFLRSLQEMGSPIRIQTIGKSAKDKPMPLVIASRPPVSNPSEAKRLGKPVVYVQANIHAGEVEGKEAILQILRDLSKDDTSHILDKLVLLVTPIYNADGNDAFGPAKRNRPSQDGPDPVGERANGQGLDLNRDCIKAESPEMRAVLQHVYRNWDPEVVMDLHTTNGTRHAYELTYSPPLNPNTDSLVMKFTRDELLPGLRKSLLKGHGLKLFDYGNAEGRGADQSWRTFGEEARYVTNYAGLRNRIAVLSEAASFQPFKLRIDATRWFVLGVLNQVARQSNRIASLIRDADQRTVSWGENPKKAPQLGVRFKMASRGTETIPLEKPVPDAQIDHSKAPTAYQDFKMPVFDRFESTTKEKFPAAYVMSPDCVLAAEILARHGVIVEQLSEPWSGRADVFTISECAVSPSAFQGHKLIRLEGKYSDQSTQVEKGGFVVRTNQPLGVLIFHMLEPESLDGVSAWGFLGESFSVGSKYSIVKVYEHVNTPRTVEPWNP